MQRCIPTKNVDPAGGDGKKMKALFANHQRAYFERVKERGYLLPQTDHEFDSEDNDGFSSTSRSFTYEGNLEQSEEDFISKNIKNASHPMRSAAVRSYLSKAQSIPLSKVIVPSFVLFFGLRVHPRPDFRRCSGG